MVDEAKVKRLKRTVMLYVGALFVTWFVINFAFLTAHQNGGIRFVLALLFSLLILLRPKHAEHEKNLPDHEPMPMSWAITGVAGVFIVLAGLVFRIHQVEWLGLLMLIYASLRWIMPPRASKDIFLSLFLLYWAHPLPAQVFAPLQFAMQRISVNVSEWFMHIINVRVWADDLLLRTGRHVYEIPAACSGLKTATTVFLLSIGLSILHRFRFLETALVVVIALIQAVILNVLRITIMVTLAPKTGEGAGPQFLHDTAGIIVVAAVVVVYVEIFLFERIRRARAIEAADLDSGIIKGLYSLPAFWNRLASRKIMLSVMAVAGILGLGLLYKSRSYHRAGMYKMVAEGLKEAGDLKNAERLAKETLALVPYDNRWRLATFRIMILDSDYQEVLDQIEKLPAMNEELEMEADVLKAYALTGLKRYREAEEVMAKFPPELAGTDPRVAMVISEVGMYSNNPDMISRHIVLASKLQENIRRVRALYPYMRAHRMWKEISLSDKEVGYEEILNALSAAEAHMNLNDVPAVARVVLQCVRRWPNDARILTPVFFMTLDNFSREWEELFAEHLTRSIKHVKNPEELNVLFPMCFQLSRPDLAWAVYKRISEIDTEHPSLLMCVARYGDQWFRFRKHWLGYSSEEMGEEIDMKPLFIIGFSIKTWDTSLANVPFGRELCVNDTRSVKKKCLELALKEYKKRDDNGTMTETMRCEYMEALGAKGNISEAALQLEMMEKPALQERGRIILSGIYERAGDWHKVYESLKNYHRDDDKQLEPLLRLFRAQKNLNLGLMAHNTASRAVELFPGSSDALAAMAEINLDLNMPEEALYLFQSNRTWRNSRVDRLEAEALWETERYHLAEVAMREAFLPPRSLARVDQKKVLPPAELSIMWHNLHVPTEDDFAAAAIEIKKSLPGLKDGFMKKMNTLWLECYNQRCGGKSALMNRWLGCGGTMEEKATALNQLTLHLCRVDMIEEARNVAGAAVRFMPRSPLLWQMLISLSKADRNVIAAARKFCPQDENIWLANVVVSEDADTAAASEYNPAALTRASEFLVRAGRNDKAIELMRYATPKARGLLPVYIMGARCALFSNDRSWAIKCTRNAIVSSVKVEIPFYRKLVQIKSDGKKIDTDTEMIEALKALRESDPDNLLWVEMLGVVRFSRGGSSVLEAMYQMDAAIRQGSSTRQAFLVAAESARQIGNYEKAEELLKKAMKLYNDDVIFLNNLIYTLSMAPGRAGEAAKYLPEFEKKVKDDLAMLDTLAFAYVASGQYDKAEKVIEKILKNVPESGAFWFRAKMHKAEIALRKDMPNRAGISLRQILSNSKGISNEDVLRANRLLEESQ